MRDEAEHDQDARARSVSLAKTGRDIPEEHLVETKEVVGEDEEPAGFVQVPRILVREELRPPRRGRRRRRDGSNGLVRCAIGGPKLCQKIDGVLGVAHAGEGGGGVPAVELAEDRGPARVGVRPVSLQLHA